MAKNRIQAGETVTLNSNPAPQALAGYAEPKISEVLPS